jgi:aconitase A
VARLPISLRILLENLTRQALLGADVSSQIEALRGRLAGARVGILPARVLLDECAGVPLLIDLVSLRDAVAAAGGDAAAVNPRIPVDLLIGADRNCNAATATESGGRAKRERVGFLAWCRRNFANLRVFSCGSRDAHWGELAHPSEMPWTQSAAGVMWAFPDSLVGTHARTTAANALGVLGWGVGGLEGTATMLGKPLSLAVPEVVGIELHGCPATQGEAGELALRISEELRRHAVAGKLVEFFGRGVEALPVPARAALAALAPAIGAICLYFPVDRRTVDYLRDTGREPEKIRLIEQYASIQRLWPDVDARPPDYDAVVRLSLEELGGRVGRPGRRTRHPPLGVVPLAPVRAVRGSLREYAARIEQHPRNAAAAPASRFQWPQSCAWVSRAPFFDGLPLSAPPLRDIIEARPLVIVGDAASAEDISPSGEIAPGSAAEEYLRAAGFSAGELETYDMWRGNYEVALRATFAGPQLTNRLARDARAGMTLLLPERIPMRVFDAASEYQRRSVPLLVIAGSRYGYGPVHDWAAKGLASLGVKAVIAESFEHTHRVSLIGAGVLPLIFLESGRSATLALDGSETFDLVDLEWSVGVRTRVRCLIRRSARAITRLFLRTAIETTDELYYLRNAGILPALWREHLHAGTSSSAPDFPSGGHTSGLMSYPTSRPK